MFPKLRPIPKPEIIKLRQAAEAAQDDLTYTICCAAAHGDRAAVSEATRIHHVGYIPGLSHLATAKFLEMYSS